MTYTIIKHGYNILLSTAFLGVFLRATLRKNTQKNLLQVAAR